MADLILRPSGRPAPQSVGEVEYIDVAHMSRKKARTILDAGTPFLLFKEPVP